MLVDAVRKSFQILYHVKLPVIDQQVKMWGVVILRIAAVRRRSLSGPVRSRHHPRSSPGCRRPSRNAQRLRKENTPGWVRHVREL